MPNTTLSTALGIAYGTGAGTQQMTVPDGSRIGVVEPACEGGGGIGVDDHGTLGAGLSVPAQPAIDNCRTGPGSEPPAAWPCGRRSPARSRAPSHPERKARPWGLSRRRAP